MTREEIESARTSLQRADEILKIIGTLSEFDPFKSGNNVECYMDGATCWSSNLRKEIVAIGKRVRIEELESELAALRIGN